MVVPSMDRIAVTKLREHSCVMVAMPPDVAQSIMEWSKENIPDEWLTGDGRETEPHVTLKYGLVTPNLEDVEPFIPDETFSVQLGSIGRFTSNPDYDVLMIKVAGDDLHDLNHEITVSLENEDEHPQYTPHCTLAYVLKGQGAGLEGNGTFDGVEVNIDTFLWSSKNGDKEEIQIEQEKWMNHEKEDA